MEKADETAIGTRKKKDESAVAEARYWQERDFAQLKQMSIEERFDYGSVNSTSVSNALVAAMPALSAIVKTVVWRPIEAWC